MVNMWQMILSSLQHKVNRQSFNTWLKPTRQLSFAEGTLNVEVPSLLFADWISRHYLALIEESAKEVDGSPVQFRFTSRQPAAAHATAISEPPPSSYNPLYVYGGVGLGKTHLMHAIGNYILRSRHAVKHMYITTEAFMNQLINSIRFEKTIDFKERYRNVDVLLIDDIQFLAGKERTQEEFFHTFNALYESQKQIVITSDCTTREIPTIEERLSSRFEWGLNA